jgi:hypothetical protein
MTLHEFKYLNSREQELVLRTKAVFIGAIQDEEGIYNLYQVDGFYLEVLCNRDETRVCSFSYFEEIHLLEPYLNSINIEPIYQVLGYRA